MAEIIYEDNYLWMDILSREVRVDALPVHLTPKEWMVLARLIWSAGRPVSHFEFQWEHPTLSNHVRTIRQKLGFSKKAPNNQGREASWGSY